MNISREKGRAARATSGPARHRARLELRTASQSANALRFATRLDIIRGEARLRLQTRELFLLARSVSLSVELLQHISNYISIEVIPRWLAPGV